MRARPTSTVGSGIYGRVARHGRAFKTRSPTARSARPPRRRPRRLRTRAGSSWRPARRCRCGCRTARSRSQPGLPTAVLPSRPGTRGAGGATSMANAVHRSRLRSQRVRQPRRQAVCHLFRRQDTLENAAKSTSPRIMLGTSILMAKSPPGGMFTVQCWRLGSRGKDPGSHSPVG